MKITIEKIVYVFIYAPMAIAAILVTDFIFYVIKKYNELMFWFSCDE